VAATATRAADRHRHLLPIILSFVAAGEAAAALVAWRAPKGAWLAGALALWYAGGTLLQHPHHLAYFNEIAGGSQNGWRLLVDSNLDWGQDLKRLAEWTRANHVGKLKLSYFGSADPAYYGIDSEALPGYTSPHAARITREIEPGDTVAVSATNLQGVYLDPEDRPLMEKLRGLTPVARIGYSIFVYRPDFAWPPPGAAPRREPAAAFLLAASHSRSLVAPAAARAAARTTGLMALPEPARRDGDAWTTLLDCRPPNPRAAISRSTCGSLRPPSATAASHRTASPRSRVATPGPSSRGTTRFGSGTASRTPNARASCACWSSATRSPRARA
jgi:hypothetical protein